MSPRSNAQSSRLHKAKPSSASVSADFGVNSVEHSTEASAEPLLIVLSGPSGVGKDAVLSRMKERGYPLHFAVTATTRPQRQGEKNGEDYHFVSEPKFQEMLEKKELLEWANVYGNRYGVPRQQVRQALSQGLDVIVKVDVQGAATIKRILPDALFIFVAPASIEELKRRLRQRKTESSTELKVRIETALEEMKSLPMFGYAVVNQQGKVDQAVAQLEAIITAEKCRVSAREFTL